MVLAQGENLIKSWNYADSKSGGLFNKVKTHATIDITNKRIVYTAENANAVDRQEIFLNQVKTLSMSRSSKGNLWAIIKIVFFGILSIVLIGIPGLLRSIKELNQGSFEMSITVDGVMTEALAVTASKIVLPKKMKTSKVKVLINKAVVNEIVDTIGAVIVENKYAYIKRKSVA